MESTSQIQAPQSHDDGREWKKRERAVNYCWSAGRAVSCCGTTGKLSPTLFPSTLVAFIDLAGRLLLPPWAKGPDVEPGFSLQELRKSRVEEGLDFLGGIDGDEIEAHIAISA